MGKRFLDDNDEFEEPNGELEEDTESEDEELEEQEERPQRPHRQKDPSVEILFEDEHLVVIVKPAGLDSTRGQYSVRCVLDVLEERLKNLPGPLRLVHRLDRDTSGLMVLAKTPEAQKNLSTQWETRSVEKRYLALVHGMVQPREGVIDLLLRKTENQSRPVVPDRAKGKDAVTEYHVVEQYRQYALVEAHPVTGRMHQNRVHFAAEGTPVLGDGHYGTAEPLLLSKFKRGYKPSERKGEEKPLIARLALHAHTLKFDHPATNARMEFKRDLPKDFAAAIKQLSKYGR